MLVLISTYGYFFLFSVMEERDDDMLKKLSVKGGLVSEISSCFCMNYSNCTVLIDSCNRR